MGYRDIDARMLLQLLDMGYDIYMPKSGAWKTYCFYTDGRNIAYLQRASIGSGYSISTVHKPNRSTGTGFGLGVEGFYPTNKEIKNGFTDWPNWASLSDRESVKKYKDFNEFKNCRKHFSNSCVQVLRFDALSMIKTIADLHSCKNLVNLKKFKAYGNVIKNISLSDGSHCKYDIEFLDNSKRMSVNDCLELG